MEFQVEILQSELTRSGGCPIYTPETGMLTFVDQLGSPLIYQLDTKQDRLNKFSILDKECCSSAVPTTKEGIFLLTCGRELVEFNSTQGREQLWCAFDKHCEVPTRSSEARADKIGRIWFGTLGSEWSEEERNAVHRGMGSLYSAQPCSTNGANLRKHDENIDLSYGIGFSPDNRTMFLTDGGQRQIFAYNFDETTGELSNKRVAVDFGMVRIRIYMGIPQGFAIDERGHIWVTCYATGCVACFDPETSQLLERIQTPCLSVTSCAFGGAEMNQLFVTSQMGEEWENGGSLVRVDGFQSKGLPSYRAQLN